MRGGLQQALELVAGEAGGEASGLQDPSAVAESVEASLHALFGEFAASLITARGLGGLQEAV